MPFRISQINHIKCAVSVLSSLTEHGKFGARKVTTSLKIYVPTSLGHKLFSVYAHLPCLHSQSCFRYGENVPKPG